MPNNDHTLEDMPAQLADNPNNLAAEEVDDPPVDIENGPTETPSTCSKCTKMWMAAVVLGVLSLIMVPGLVIGIVTKDVRVGIALSGAIATVASLCAGLYYYHNTQSR